MVKAENCDVESVTSVVKEFVHGASLENDVGMFYFFAKSAEICV